MPSKNETFARLANVIEVWSRDVTNFKVRAHAKRWVRMLREKGAN